MDLADDVVRLGQRRRTQRRFAVVAAAVVAAVIGVVLALTLAGDRSGVSRPQPAAGGVRNGVVAPGVTPGAFNVAPAPVLISSDSAGARHAHLTLPQETMQIDFQDLRGPTASIPFEMAGVPTASATTRLER